MLGVPLVICLVVPIRKANHRPHSDERTFSGERGEGPGPFRFDPARF